MNESAHKNDFYFVNVATPDIENGSQGVVSQQHTAAFGFCESDV